MAPDRSGGQLELLVLSVLDRGDAHGYAVIARLRDLSEGRFDVPEGTVYPMLHRLARSGLLDSYERVEDGRSRKVYRLTRQGRAALGQAKDGWASFSRAVNVVLGTA